MSTTNYSGQESSGIPDALGVEKRTRRACEGCMVVVPHGGGTGLFDVYSARDGQNTIYTVDLREERCTCPDYQHRQPAGGCKHIRRVKLGLGIMAVPEGVDVEYALARDREKYGVDPEPEPPEAGAEADADAEPAVATDGGTRTKAYTTHAEPPEHGGTYAKCTGCGREIVPVSRFEKLAHAADCPNAREDADANGGAGQ